MGDLFLHGSNTPLLAAFKKREARAGYPAACCGVVHSAYLDISNKFTKLQAAYNRERSGNERVTNRLEEVLEENRELRIVAADFGRIKAVVGSE